MWRHSYVVSAYIATLPYVTCEIFLRVPVKITVQVLAAGCQLSYRIFYGFCTGYSFSYNLVFFFSGSEQLQSTYLCAQLLLQFVMNHYESLKVFFLLVV